MLRLVCTALIVISTAVLAAEEAAAVKPEVRGPFVGLTLRSGASYSCHLLSMQEGTLAVQLLDGKEPQEKTAEVRSIHFIPAPAVKLTPKDHQRLRELSLKAWAGKLTSAEEEELGALREKFPFRRGKNGPQFMEHFKAAQAAAKAESPERMSKAKIQSTANSNGGNAANASMSAETRRSIYCPANHPATAPRVTPIASRAASTMNASVNVACAPYITVTQRSRPCRSEPSG